MKPDLREQLEGVDFGRLTPEQRSRLLALLQKRAQLIREHYAETFRPYPKQLAFFAAGKTYRERLLMAANQVGKTLAGGFEIAAHATGIYPSWWPGRRFDKPTRGWVSGVTGESTRDNPQRVLLGPVGSWGTGMIPKSRIKKVVKAAHGVSDLLDMVFIEHISGGTSVIAFKSYEKGREKWQGETLNYCIAEGQRVMLADGRFLPIEQVEPGMRVLTVDQRGRRVVRKVVAVHDKGERDVVDVETSRGPWIRMTSDHEVYETTRTKTPVAQAKRILMPPAHWEPEQPMCCFSDAHYAWLGLVIAEGSVSQHKVTMGECPSVLSAVDMLPTEARVRRKDFSGGHVPDWHLYWADFWALVPPGLAHEKVIPDWVFMSPNRKIALFLSYLFAGDGWASGHGIGYASTSRVLIEQISVLLWRLGIRSSMGFKPAKDNWRAQWSVHVSSAEHVLLFAERIGIVGKEDALSKVGREARRRMKSSAARGDQLTRAARNDPDETVRRAYYLQQNRAQKDRFAAIQTLHPGGQCRVYDLSVEEDHRFIAGLGVVSNCWFDEEPPLDIYSEGLTRTQALGGFVIVTFTPLLGMSNTVKRFIVDKTPGTHVTSMTIHDVEHYTEEEKAVIIAGYPAHERDARASGIPILGSGRVFPVEELTIREGRIDLPHHWPRLAGMDFGWTHPTAVVWAAWDRDTDTIHIYDEHRASQTLNLVHAAAIKSRGPWIPVSWPHDGENGTAQGEGVSLASQYRSLGVRMLPERAQFPDGTISTEAANLELLDRMMTGRFKVASHLSGWWEEFRLYHRKDGKLVKVNDDLMSATHKIVMSLRFADIAPTFGVNQFAGAPFGVLDPEVGF